MVIELTISIYYPSLYSTNHSITNNDYYIVSTDWYYYLTAAGMFRRPRGSQVKGSKVFGALSIFIRHYRTDLHGHKHIYLHLDTYTYLPRCIGVHGSEALGATCALLIISWAPGMTFDNREHHTK